jgi:hypothetical protein
MCRVLSNAVRQQAKFWEKELSTARKALTQAQTQEVKENKATTTLKPGTSGGGRRRTTFKDFVKRSLSTRGADVSPELFVTVSILRWQFLTPCERKGK